MYNSFFFISFHCHCYIHPIRQTWINLQDTADSARLMIDSCTSDRCFLLELLWRPERFICWDRNRHVSWVETIFGSAAQLLKLLSNSSLFLGAPEAFYGFYVKRSINQYLSGNLLFSPHFRMKDTSRNCLFYFFYFCSTVVFFIMSKLLSEMVMLKRTFEPETELYCHFCVQRHWRRILLKELSKDCEI